MSAGNALWILYSGKVSGYGRIRLLAYHAYGTKHKKLAITYGVLAVLFQPFVKLTLGRDVWIGVDIAVAVFLVIVMVRNKEFKFHK